MNTGSLEIKYLSENPQYACVVSNWIYDEFIKDIRNDLTLDELTVRIKNCNKNTLPIRLIAVLGGECAGTVSIVENDLKSRDYSPWLAALVVDKSYRGNGIGQKLISYVQELALQLGYQELYLRTEHAGGYYKKLGWQFVEKCTDQFGLEPEVYKYTL